MSEHTTKPTETKFSMSQVANLIGVHRTTILRLLDAGKLGCYQSGIVASYLRATFKKFLSRAERKATVEVLP